MADIEYLTENEAKAILNAAADIRDKAILTLFLDAGVFLNELTDLNIDSIDWKKKILRLKKTNRKRDVPLNDETFNALVDWSKERADSKTEALFITSKGEVNRLSPRNIDRLIRKYADDAGISKTVNAQVLRNTFAIRFLKKETAIDKASYILGISSSRGLRRYVQAARSDAAPSSSELEHVDTRPPIVRHLSKLVLRKHKEARVLKVPAKVGNAEITIGRDSAISEIKDNLHKSHSTVLHSNLGIGKTHILKHIAQEGGYLYLNSPAPAKDFLGKICERYIPDWQDKLAKKSRASAQEITSLIIDGVKKREIIVIDNLDRLRKSDLDLFIALLDHFVILGAAEDLPDRLKPIWWKMKKIDLEPLSDEAAHALIVHLTQDLAVENRKLLETQIASHASGDPLAIVEMVNQLRGLPRVRESDIRSLHHEAGAKYIEVKNLVVLIWFAAVVYRFVSLGMNSFENYLLAGFLTSTALLLKNSLRRL